MMSLLDTLTPRRTPAAKAVTGPFAGRVEYGVPLSALDRSSATTARDAQAVGVRDPWVRASERVIGDRFSTVGWHLEDADGTTVGRQDGQNDDPAYLAVLDLVERPYTPAPRDPVTATPRTRSQMWRVTSRHMGLCGIGYWFLDQTEGAAGTPLQLLYVNPARMTPATNAAGQLIGWALDADRSGRGGVPLELSQVLPFPLEHPDSGFVPAGLVESALGKDAVVRFADRHAADVLASGGRLSGIVAPPGDQTIPEEQFEQMKLDFRAASEAPDATRRLIILRGPVEFRQTVATPEQLALVDVANQMGRDAILALWGVPGSQLGLPGASGLNSGDAKSYDEAVLWQNAVGPRVRTFAETLQYGLLDRYAALGVVVRIVVDEPSFDDDTPMFDRASKATKQPLTNRERRALVNLDPFGDARDDEVWMESGMVRTFPEEGPAPVPPALRPFAGVPPAPDATEAEEDDALGEVPDREGVAGKATADGLGDDLRRFLSEWGGRVAGQVESHADHLARKPGDSTVWWDGAAFEAGLSELLDRHVVELARSQVGAAGARAAGKADITPRSGGVRPAGREPHGILANLLPRLLRRVGLRVAGIGRTTRELVARAIREGIEQGLSPRELGEVVRAAGFGEARAEAIARTEAATVLNEAAIASYRELEVTHVQVTDGDEDDECAEADGQTWTLDEAESSPLAHPNCTRSFAPVIGATA